MSKQTYVTRHSEIIRNEWFRSHQARILAESETTSRTFEWRHPTWWAYGMRFILHEQWLMVVGDLGEATYRWSERITPAFLAGLDFGYFRSKCQASENGRGFDLFDAEAGKEALMAEWQSLDEPHSKWSAVLHELAAKVGQCSCLDEWRRTVGDYYESGDIDAESASEAVKMAVFPHPRQIAHWLGVKMALEQLAKGGAA